ncbi:MAG: Gmad2 immunoglobulin-like domain-containing protein [Terricaulis sp.]
MVRALALSAALALMACSPAAETPAPAPEAPAPVAAAASTASLVIVASPLANARVTSPLQVTGTAPAQWVFEAQFPLQLVGADGAVLAEAPARTDGDAVTPQLAFAGELTFTVAAETPATLVLQEDMPEEGAVPQEVRIPIVLMPAR